MIKLIKIDTVKASIKVNETTFLKSDIWSIVFNKKYSKIHLGKK